MNIKARYVITCVLAALAIVMAALSVPVFQSFGTVAAAAPEVELVGAAARAVEPLPFVLREWSGKIAIFTPDSEDAPAAVTDIKVASLREVDQQMLRDGIGVRDSAALAALLEDFGS